MITITFIKRLMFIKSWLFQLWVNYVIIYPKVEQPALSLFKRRNRHFRQSGKFTKEMFFLLTLRTCLHFTSKCTKKNIP